MAWTTARKSKKTNAFKELENLRELVLKELEAALERGAGLEKLFEVRGEALQEAVVINRCIRDSNALPARELYSGVMYDAVDYKTLKAAEKKLFDKQTLILSGLFGVLRPTDRIPPYKLKMSARLGGVVGKVAAYWRKPASEILRREVKGKVVWDFLPDQHRRVWDSTGEIKARHQVKFVKRVVRDGVAEYKTISHHSKSLKGALIRHLLANDAESPKALQTFVHPDGYQFNREMSVNGRRESLLVFAAD